MCDSPVSARKERETSQVSKGGLKKIVDFFHTRGGVNPESTLLKDEEYASMTN